MKEYKYMKVKLYKITSDIIQHYNLDKISQTGGYVYMEIRKGMLGLNQAGKIANNSLVKHLNKYRYLPCPITPAL